MKISETLLSLLLLLAVIPVSGCIGGQQITGGPGLVIEAFEPDFPQIYDGESVQLRALIRNRGSMRAGEIKAKISGADWIAGTECTETELLPAVPENGIEGEVKTCQWNIKSNTNLPEGVSMTYYPILNVYYIYSTSTVKSITIGSADDIRRIQNTGGSLPSETTSSTSGPVSIDIVIKGPLRASENRINFPVEIRITNNGGGVVCIDRCDETNSENWNKLNLNINAGEPLELDCGDASEISLWRGQSNTIGCKASISGQATLTQALITVTATYGYRIDKTTSITVTGTE